MLVESLLDRRKSVVCSRSQRKLRNHTTTTSALLLTNFVVPFSLQYTTMNLFYFFLFAGTLITATSAFSVPHIGNNPRTVATVRLESPSLGEPLNHHDVLATNAAVPLGLSCKIKNFFGLMGQRRGRRTALFRTISRLVVAVALWLAVQIGPIGVLPARAHPPPITAMAPTVETVIPRAIKSANARTPTPTRKEMTRKLDSQRGVTNFKESEKRIVVWDRISILSVIGSGLMPLLFHYLFKPKGNQCIIHIFDNKVKARLAQLLLEWCSSSTMPQGPPSQSGLMKICVSSTFGSGVVAPFLVVHIPVSQPMGNEFIIKVQVDNDAKARLVRLLLDGSGSSAMPSLVSIASTSIFGSSVVMPFVIFQRSEPNSNEFIILVQADSDVKARLAGMILDWCGISAKPRDVPSLQ
jgi:hypothetical protein